MKLYKGRSQGGCGGAPPPQKSGGGQRPKYFKIIKKWPENMSREVKISKIFLPLPLDPIPLRPKNHKSQFFA